jgi:hypothetical protein
MTAWNTVFLEKKMAAQVLKESAPLIEIQISLPCLEKPTTGPYLESDE